VPAVVANKVTGIVNRIYKTTAERALLAALEDPKIMRAMLTPIKDPKTAQRIKRDLSALFLGTTTSAVEVGE